MAKYTIIFYLEDAAQEAIIPPLVERLIQDEGKNIGDYALLVLGARGGGSISAYKAYIKQVKKQKNLNADVLIVGSDGNCNGFTKRRQQLMDASKNIPYPYIITAIPDPHVERWYMLDGHALAMAADTAVQAVVPAIKCDKNHYKTLLKKTFTDQNVFPPLGGIEYGPEVAKTMDLYAAGTADHAFRDFVDQVRSWIRLQP